MSTQKYTIVTSDGNRHRTKSSKGMEAFRAGLVNRYNGSSPIVRVHQPNGTTKDVIFSESHVIQVERGWGR